MTTLTKSAEKIQASSPGKVLILGGYLIVQAPNVGISIGVNARFTTRVLEVEASTSDGVALRILSPQFKQEFVFQCTVKDNSNVVIQQLEGKKSPFLYYAVLFAVSAAVLRRNSVKENITLELLADNDFYSQRNYLESTGTSVNVKNLRALPPHLPLVGEVSKTGLGSSAAMTTSVVACIFSHFHGFSEGMEEKEFIHRVAQVAHSVAQGKIGSGFDVYTAVYGTCAYRRFPAEKVEAMVKGSEDLDHVLLPELETCLNLSEEWVPYVPFHLPRGVKLVLGDVHQGGSSTPGMVAKIMAWQKQHEKEENNLWERLRHNNELYIEALRDMIQKSETLDYQTAVEKLATQTGIAQWEAGNEYEASIVKASRCGAESRRLLRELGVAAGVKVEPEELTELLDDTAALPGVFAVGCPGAGGYDAVFALVLGDNNCEKVENFWEQYSKINVCPLTVREDPGGLCIERK